MFVLPTKGFSSLKFFGILLLLNHVLPSAKNTETNEHPVHLFLKDKGLNRLLVSTEEYQHHVDAAEDILGKDGQRMPK